MKNIILQHFDGQLRKLDQLSINNISKYARFVGADYKLVLGKPFREQLTAPCQKVYMIDEVWDQYDNVLMLDIDMFVPRGMTINIFNETGVGLYADVQKRLHSRLAASYPTIGSLTAPYWGGAIYKFDLKQRERLRAGLGGDESWMINFNQPYHYEDEGIMHVLANRAGFGALNAYLDNKWCQCSFLPNPEKAGFIHIRTKVTPSGPKREKIENYNALVQKGIIE